MGQEVSTPEDSPGAMQNAEEEKFLVIERSSDPIIKINPDLMEAIEFKRSLLETKNMKEKIELKMKAREEEYGKFLNILVAELQKKIKAEEDKLNAERLQAEMQLRLYEERITQLKEQVLQERKDLEAQKEEGKKKIDELKNQCGSS